MKFDPISSMSAKRRFISFSSVLLAGVIMIYTAYMPSYVRHFFTADDWYWLYSAQFYRYSEIFSLFPRAIYNDRPVGAIFVKLVYEIFGINIRAFLSIQCLVHIVNCIILYFIGRKYIGHTGSLVAAVVACAWLSTNNAVYWTAAIFDLLGATLCLLATLLWINSLNGKHGFFYSIAGALAYYLAIRTKEFAIGLPAVIFALGILVENSPIAIKLRRFVPYLIVMAAMGFRYAYLLYSSNLIGNKNDVYGIHFDGILDSIYFYFTKTFYIDAFGPSIAIAAVLIFLVSSVFSRAYFNFLLFCFVAYIVMLGPTLLLANHLGILYTYAPHFFIALAVGALVSGTIYQKVAAVSVSAALVILPQISLWNLNRSNFVESKTSSIKQQYESFFSIVGMPEDHDIYYIAGLENYFNPFAYGPGYSIKVTFQNLNVNAVIEKPRPQLVKEFCADTRRRHFIEYSGNNAINKTDKINIECKNM